MSNEGQSVLRVLQKLSAAFHTIKKGQEEGNQGERVAVLGGMRRKLGDRRVKETEDKRLCCKIRIQ